MQHYDPFENWQQWKYHYRKELWHPVGYEEQFVDMVLSQITIITPSDVIPQWHFVDDMGGDRYVDFVIINEAKGYNLAIELDGLTKLQDGVGNLDYRKYGDLWLRQNDLMGKVGMLLRFTNQQMKYRTQWVIDRIVNTLNQQSHQHITHVSMVDSYKNKIAELQAKADSSQQIQDSIAMLQQQLLEIKANQLAQSAQSVTQAIEKSSGMAKIPTSQEILAEQARTEQIQTEKAKHDNPPPLPPSQPVKQDRSMYWIGGALLAVLVVGFVYVLGQSSAPIETSANEPEVTYSSVTPVIEPVLHSSDASDAASTQEQSQQETTTLNPTMNPETVQSVVDESVVVQSVVEPQPTQRISSSVQIHKVEPVPTTATEDLSEPMYKSSKQINSVRNQETTAVTAQPTDTRPSGELLPNIEEERQDLDVWEE